MNEAKSFIEILKEHVNSDKAQLPPFNRTGLAIQQEMARPDPDMQVIEKQILRDPAVAGQLLKVANSSFYHVNRAGRILPPALSPVKAFRDQKPMSVTCLTSVLATV
ncbi:MAG: HDOD domain-containing protein [Anaerolineales bacterium]